MEQRLSRSQSRTSYQSVLLETLFLAKPSLGICVIMIGCKTVGISDFTRYLTHLSIFPFSLSHSHIRYSIILGR